MFMMDVHEAIFVCFCNQSTNETTSTQLGKSTTRIDVDSYSRRDTWIMNKVIYTGLTLMQPQWFLLAMFSLGFSSKGDETYLRQKHFSVKACYVRSNLSSYRNANARINHSIEGDTDNISCLKKYNIERYIQNLQYWCLA